MDAVLNILGTILSTLFNIITQAAQNTSTEEMYVGGLVSSQVNTLHQRINQEEMYLGGSITNGFNNVQQRMNQEEQYLGSRFSDMAQAIYNTSANEEMYIGSALNNTVNAMAEISQQERAALGSALWSMQQGISQQLGQEEIYLGATLNGAVGNIANVLDKNTEEMRHTSDAIVNAVTAEEGHTISAIQTMTEELQTSGKTTEELLRTIASGSTEERQRTEQGYWQAMTGFPDAFQSAFKVLPGRLGEEMKSNLLGGLDDIFSSIFSQWEIMREIIDKFISGEYKSLDDAVQDMQSHGIHAEIMLFIVNLTTLIFTMLAVATSKLAPVKMALDGYAWSDNPSRPMDAGILLQLDDKKLLDKTTFNQMMAKLGYGDEASHFMALADDKPVDIGSLTQYLWRGKITQASFNEAIARMGLVPGAEDVYFELTRSLLGAQDLTRIADKQIWQRGIPEKYGQYAELPPEYIQRMAQWGYTEDDTKLVWAAHWNLPSPQQVFEMFQRGKITRDDMEVFLKLTDWLPFFRDALLKISYNPISRVDIRRIYGLGLLDRAGVIQRYKDIGYEPQDAELLADFTIKYEDETSDDSLTKVRTRVANAIQGLYARGKLTRSEAILQLVRTGKSQQVAEATIDVVSLEVAIDGTPINDPAYKTETINRVKSAFLGNVIPLEVARQYLLQLGYSEMDADTELSFLQMDKAIAWRKKLQDGYVKLFLQGAIDNAELTSTLAFNGFSPDEVDAIMADITLQQRTRNKMPTETQVKAWFKAGLVDEIWIENYLRFIGYQDNMIPLVMAGDFKIGV